MSFLLYREISAASSCNQTMPGAGDSAPWRQRVVGLAVANHLHLPCDLCRDGFASDGPSRVNLDVFCCVDTSAARLPAREAVRSAFACKPQTDQAARQPLVGGHQAAGPNRLLGVFWFAGCLNMRLGQRKRIIRTNCSSGGSTRPTTQTPLPDPGPLEPLHSMAVSGRD